MKKFLIFLFFLTFSISNAQNANQYKYALVPSQFKFLKEKDEYRLNTLTKLLMEKYGFVAYLDTESIDEEILTNSCNKVYVDVESVGNMFAVKLKVILTDCKKNVLFTSSVGTSKYKEYKEAYTDALRKAFDSFVLLHYKYTPPRDVQVKSVTKEIISPSEILPTVTNSVSNNIIEESVPISGVLFAQPIANGFQLVDTTPKVVMKIYNTSIKNYFIASNGNIHGVLISKDNQWYFEYYQNEKLISEKIDVKF